MIEEASKDALVTELKKAIEAKGFSFDYSCFGQDQSEALESRLLRNVQSQESKQVHQQWRGYASANGRRSKKPD